MGAFQDAFISYGRADSLAFAIKLHQRLLEHGLAVWFDKNDIPYGVDYQNQIDDGIEKADNFLFIIAPHSVNSPYCLKEIELAIRRNKRIIPLLHVEQISQETWQQRNPGKDVAVWQEYQAKGLHSSFPNMHPLIGKINWIYFREGADDFEQSLTNLLGIIERNREYVRNHTQLLAKALDWEQQQRRSSYLLIGDTRRQAEEWLSIRFKTEQPPCLPTDLHCEFISESRKNADNLMTQVFLAHAETDNAISERIRYSLMREGFTVWTNKIDIQTGGDFQTAINRGIEEADNLVYLISPDALRSHYCQQELDYARSLNKRIIPILARKTNLSEVPPLLRELQYIDLTDNIADEDYRLDEHQLLKILRQDAAYYEDHKMLLAKALKWQRQERNPSILLRGYNLRHAEGWLKGAKQHSHAPTTLQEEFIHESLQQPPESSLDVFMSYSRTDSDFARKLNEALQFQGKTTWFDQESIASGTDFQREIYRGVENSNTFLCIISPFSIQASYCIDEVEYAQKLNKRIVTVLHSAIDVDSLHPALKKVQWIDFTQGEEFSTQFNELVHTLDIDPAHAQTHTRLLVRSLEWENRGRHESVLLRGIDLEEAEQWLTTSTQKEPKPAELQGEYIGTSRKTETLRQKTEIKRQRQALVLISAGFMIAVISTIVALQQRAIARKEQVNAEINAKSLAAASLLTSGLSLDALLEALRMGRQLQQANRQVEPATRMKAINALRDVVFQIREYNSFKGHQKVVLSVAFSPDGKTIASASVDRTLKLWSVDGKLLHTFAGHTDAVNAVKFSPDGKTIVSASADQTLRLWSLDGQMLKTWNSLAAVNGVAFSPDGQTIASANQDQTIRLWNRQGKLLKTLKGSQDALLDVAFSPDGKTIAAVGFDDTIHRWTLQGNALPAWSAKTQGINAIAFSPNGKTIATAGANGNVQIWNPTGQVVKTLKTGSPSIASVVFSPDSTTLATAGDNNLIQIWHRDGQLLQTLKGHRNSVFSLAFSPDGKTLVSGSYDRTVKLWNLQGQAPIILAEHGSQVWDVSFSPDGQTIASVAGDQTVRLWHRNGQLLKKLSGHLGNVYGVAFSPDSKTIASAGEDKTLRLWSLDGKLLNTFKGHTQSVRGISFSPDGNTIVSVGEDKTIRLWDGQGKLLKTFSGHQEITNDISFSPDGKLLASASADKTVKLWRVDGTLLRTLTGHGDIVWNVNFSPDGKTLTTTSEDSTVRIWNLEGKLLNVLKGYTDFASGISFSPDGKIIATGGGDREVKLWSLDGQPITSLPGHQDWIRSVHFSPDGNALISASDDKTVMVWDLNLESLIEDGCRWMQDYLATNPDLSVADRSLCPVP